MLAALFFLVPSILAHGGHEQVPEGSAVSEDPIVRRPFFFFLFGLGEYRLTVTGLDIMDSHDSYGSRVWYHLSAGNGSGGMFLVIVDYS